MKNWCFQVQPPPYFWQRFTHLTGLPGFSKVHICVFSLAPPPPPARATPLSEQQQRTMESGSYFFWWLMKINCFL